MENDRKLTKRDYTHLLKHNMSNLSKLQWGMPLISSDPKAESTVANNKLVFGRKWYRNYWDTLQTHAVYDYLACITCLLGLYDAHSEVRQQRTHLQLIWYTNELYSHTWIWEGRWHRRCCQEKKRVSCQSWFQMVFISLEVQLLDILTPEYSGCPYSGYSFSGCYLTVECLMRCEPSHTKIDMP